ncbi:MAG: lipid-A-disaccharide synthase [Jaaginema sp. PMC 1079.18]|nr:lipid-A-disaccharide synthase [Jaaginema sp. PMC 1080.18]MEC4853555.1 lipid-A-disaccharide synthase [Jaaginema sp. PMC 1079.18]MEC4866650.1 lipid-A-disaccharide synthase [Jaaginema sp. PMC 1078.18]
MRIFICTGEVSGDLQGSMLIESLQRYAQAQGIEIEITGVGGDRMAAAGAKLLGNTTDLSSVGVLEAVPFILPTLRLQKRIKDYLAANPPDIFVAIDYPGFNLTLSQSLRQQYPDLPIVYYIAPQDWVWQDGVFASLFGHTERMLASVDHLLAIFPEEARYFSQKGISVDWVGHPILDRLVNPPQREAVRQTLGLAESEIAIALIPASRPQELTYILPVIAQAAQKLHAKLPNARFWLPLSLEVYRPKITAICRRYDFPIEIFTGNSLDLLAGMDLAITKSGTVNLELALLNVPQVVLYRVSGFTAWVGQRFKFSIPFMSPPNLVLMKPILPELLQAEATPERIVAESLDFLLNSQRRTQLATDYGEMRSRLGEVGACDRAAKAILDFKKQN